MEISIITATRPAIAAGQVWKHVPTGNYYLALKEHGGAPIKLHNLKYFNSIYSTLGPFGENAKEFEYTGIMKVGS